MTPTVELEHVWKQYSMAGLVGRTIAAFFPRHHSSLGKGRGWALRDASLTLRAGDRLGVIGRNGAGKTTLLRLLAGITRPTSGKVMTRGRIAALIALGAGFHMELTGRENIFLNGTILGYSRAKLRQKLDEIIAFAELGEYIDMPVKFYSSGMYARLGFSVAVHVEPEILLVDEVLSVGDAAFQMKSFDRMKQFCRSGCTVIFVSHRMGAVTLMCDQALWLEGGVAKEMGEAKEVTRHYLEALEKARPSPVLPLSPEETPSAFPLVLTKATLLNGDEKETEAFHYGEDLIVRLHYDARRDIQKPWFILWVEGKNGPLFGSNMAMDGQGPPILHQGKGHLDCIFQKLPLKTGIYDVAVQVRHEFSSRYLEPRTVAQFRMTSLASAYGDTTDVADAIIRDGFQVHVPYRWRFDESESEILPQPMDRKSH